MAAPSNSTITILPTLFFVDKGPEAAAYYTSVFPSSRITDTVYNPRNTSIPLTITLTLLENAAHPIRLHFINVPESSGQKISFSFNQSFSLSVICETQDEIDYYWEKLTDGGDVSKQKCCWCEDKYGLSWQIVPTLVLKGMEKGGEWALKTQQCFMGWGKPDIQAMEKALEGMN